MQKLAAILLSRQPLRPDGKTTWIRKTVEAIAWAQERGLMLVSSVGTQTWEMVTALALQRDILQRLVLPLDSSGNLAKQHSWLACHFRLGRGACDVQTLPKMPAKRDRHSLWSFRDEYIVNQADVLIPISVRPGGTMSALLERAAVGGKKILRRFQCPYRPRSERLSYRLDVSYLNPDLERLDGPWVVHWTRSPNTSWPDEPRIDYYLAVEASDTYPRTAFETLLHIADTGKVLATVRHMPGRTRCVSFSGLKPLDVVPLIRWRARYSQMSFEPYGLGIALEQAAHRGIQPVRYIPSGSRPGMACGTEPWLRQSEGTRGDWRQEAEYRCLGDFVFSQIPAQDIILFCMTPSEAVSARHRTGLRVVPMLARSPDWATGPYRHAGGAAPPPKRYRTR